MFFDLCNVVADVVDEVHVEIVSVSLENLSC
jgi:hypothetical protein